MYAFYFYFFFICGFIGLEDYYIYLLDCKINHLYIDVFIIPIRIRRIVTTKSEYPTRLAPTHIYHL